MTFGRKGLAQGEVQTARQSGFGRAGQQGGGVRTAAKAAAPIQHAQPAQDEEMAAKRAAFIASERARSAQIADPLGQSASNPAAHPAVRPAQPLPSAPVHEAVGASGLTASQEVEIRASVRGGAHGNSWGNAPTQAPAYSPASPQEKFLLGHPRDRNLVLAYVWWFVLGQISMHRFYCGQSNSGFIQLALFLGSLAALLVFPVAGIVGFGAWVIWIFADLFLIPGMMRRLKAQYDNMHHVFA